MAKREDKPKGGKISSLYGTEQYFSVTIPAGQPIGLLLTLTYPTAMTVITNRH